MGTHGMCYMLWCLGRIYFNNVRRNSHCVILSTFTCAIIIYDGGRFPFEELHDVQDGIA